MYKKKKNNSKDIIKHKKVPLITVPSFNITQEQPRGGAATSDIKSMVRSIQLRKVSANPYKKSISRKSTCKSVKQNGTMRPPELKTIMQTFKELKMMHEQSRSKSKSPASCKSRSTKQYFPHKKKSYATLGTNPNSQVNLTLKLQRTIKQLNQTDFFRDQDSLLPIRSSSDLISDEQRPANLSTDNEEDIDLNQLRNFCSTVKLDKAPMGLTLKNYNNFKENRAALKIQRAWRQYQTKRLVDRYVYLSRHQQDSLQMVEIQPPSPLQDMQQSEQSLSNQPSQSHQHSNLDRPLSDAIVVSSDQFYHQGLQGSKVRHISNLQSQGGSSGDYEQVVKRMKMEQLQKWNQIIQIISKNKSDNPQELERLLQKLTEQSEINKKQLEIKANSILNRSQKKHNRTEEEEEEKDERVHLQQHINNKREYSSSDHSASAGLEEYDSKKYIEYLDGDIFPPQNDHLLQPERGVCISKRKQEILLEQLRSSHLPIKLGESSLYRSQSVKGIERTHRRQNSNKSSSRSGLRKSTSQKVLRSAIQNMSMPAQQEQQDETEQLNLDLLTKEFLQGSDPHADNFDMVYSEQKLRSKLAQLSKLKQEYNQEENVIHEQTYHRDEDEDDLQGMTQLKRSQPSLQLHQPMSTGAEMRIQQGTPQKLQVELIQHEILSDSQGEQQQNARGQTCAAVILNTLIIEVLKDIAKSDHLSQAFKDYTLSLKPKVRKSQGGKKKKGFPTSKAQIQLFLQGLLRYLSKQQPGIFHNLQVSTGPSALQMLRYMHQSGQEQAEEGQDDEDEDESNVMVIPNRVFDAFWQLKQKSIVIQVPQHFDHSNTVIFKHQFELLKSFNKIFYRSLFDTFNECLDCQRNFGQYGRPFPWKRSPAFDHHKSQQTLQLHVQKARKKMIDLSITYCGLIIEKEDMVNSINEQYVKQVHEDRLSRMLANDLMEAEDRWIFYDDEETEILVQISSALYTELLIEVIEELYEGL